MSRWFVPVRSSVADTVAALALAGLVLGCAGQTPGSGSTSSSAPAATAVPSDPGVAVSVSPSVSSRAAGPPDASLAVEGGDPAVGQLGSFTWADGGSDSAWLPGTPVAMAAGEPLTVTLADGVGVAEWSARRVPAGTSDGAGAVGLGGGPSPVTFAAPGPGSWSVQVDLTFAGGLGAAAYYWQLTVK
jgi:hypothetical protein